MAEMNIFQRGDKAKFIITSQNVNLNMETCDFYVFVNIRHLDDDW